MIITQTGVAELTGLVFGKQDDISLGNRMASEWNRDYWEQGEMGKTSSTVGKIRKKTTVALEMQS